MSLAIRKKPVDEDAAEGEDEDEQAPEDLVEGWAVGLEDLDCVKTLCQRHVLHRGVEQGVGEEHILQTMMSRTRTMKPKIPPPVPQFWAGLKVDVLMGAAKATEAMRSWRKRHSILTDCFGCGV